MYLREMGTVPLLTREGEVEIAKRIERGQNAVLKTMSRSAIIMQEILDIGKAVKSGERSIKEIIVFSDEELGEEMLIEKANEFLGEVDEIKYATGAGAIDMGFPIIADTAIPEILPTGICTFEHVVRELDHEKIVPRAIKCGR
jgi:RNA polymerase primary sigma factor